MIIAVDGPAGAGKSTIAKLLAEKLGFLYVDTGAMYRALTLKADNQNMDFSDIPGLVKMAEKTKIVLEKNKKGKTIVFLDGFDVSDAIREPIITNAVYKLARLAEIRQIMVSWQRDYGKKHSIVMEGRDIGTVVFPKAEIKFYLDATAEIRAKRRMIELKEKEIDILLEELIKQIEERDHKDKTRKCGPLKIDDDAIYIDSSALDIPQVVDTMLNYLKDYNEK
ncbi:MAG: (d)CMP kinase [Candidatus Omnitrophica bacterium]|nr:(d)CMP kinase [Candidatus Omnitrophota bacterium]